MISLGLGESTGSMGNCLFKNIIW